VENPTDVLRHLLPDSIYFVCAGPAGQPSLEPHRRFKLASRSPSYGGMAVGPLTRSVRTIPFAVVSVTPPPAAVTDDQTRSKPKRARRRKRKPLISDDQWAQIEKAYGYNLDAAIRTKVLRVTAKFVLFESFERAALPLAEAKERVLLINGSAGKLFSDLFGGPSDDATTFADELFDRHLRNAGLTMSLRELLLSLAAACNSALAEMERSPSHREGACWDR